VYRDGGGPFLSKVKGHGGYHKKLRDRNEGKETGVLERKGTGNAGNSIGALGKEAKAARARKKEGAITLGGMATEFSERVEV